MGGSGTTVTLYPTFITVVAVSPSSDLPVRVILK